MSIKELVAVLPPPREPIEVGARSWLAIERDLGTKLPSDWREFSLRYGSGYFGDRIYVLNVFSPSFKKVFKGRCDHLRHIEKELGLPFEVFPHRPGLLPWASDNNGHKMLWLAEGNPEKWPIIVRRSDGEHERWDLPMTAFLAKALSHEIRCIAWTNRFLKKYRTFTPKPLV